MGPTGPVGPTGPPGPRGATGGIGPGLNIKGRLSSANLLPLWGEQGDAYFVVDDLWAWVTDDNRFVYVSSPLRGWPGDTGPQGTGVKPVHLQQIPPGVTPPAIPANARVGDLLWDASNFTLWRVRP